MACFPSRPRDAASLVCLVAIGLISVGSLWLRLPAVDPRTLWFDDLTYAVLAKAPLDVAVTAPAHVSPGFIGLSWIMLRLFGDPEWSLQLLPLALGLLSIPVMALIVYRVTRSRALAIVAAALAASNPLLAHYSVYVKPYTLEFFGGALLLAYATVSLGEAGARIRTQAGAALLGACLLPVAAPTGLISAPIVHLGGLTAIWRNRRSRSRVLALIATMLCFDIWVLAAVVSLRVRASEAIQNFHSDNFAPAGDPVETTRFAASSLRKMLELGVPGTWSERLWVPDITSWPLVLMAAGLVALMLSRHTRSLGISLIMTCAGALIASSMGFYPLGLGRTDCWFFSIPILLFCVGLQALTNWLPRPEGPRLVMAALAVAFFLARPPIPIYWPIDDIDLLEGLKAKVDDRDALLLSGEAPYPVAYYGPWQAIVQPSPGRGRGARVQILREHTAVLTSSTSDQEVRGLLSELRPLAIWYLAYRPDADELDVVLGTFADLGYEVVSSEMSTRTQLYRLEITHRLESLLLDLGTAADEELLGLGWSHRESAGDLTFRWSDGAAAGFFAPLSLKRPYALAISAEPFTYEDAADQVVEVLANGAVIDTIDMHSGRLWGYQVVIPQPIIRRGLNYIEFRFSRTASPANLGISDDARQLGVKFDYIRLRPIE